jgi:hypothetical protein
MRGRVVRALGSTEEKADIIGPHKWPGFVGEGKETLAYGKAATAFLPGGTEGSHLHAAIWFLSVVSAGGAPWRVSTREGPFIGPALAIRYPAPRPTFRRRTAGSAVVCCRRQPNRRSRQRCSPGIGRGNEHDAAPMRLPPPQSRGSAIVPEIACATANSRRMTPANRLLPVPRSWTDQASVRAVAD